MVVLAMDTDSPLGSNIEQLRGSDFALGRCSGCCDCCDVLGVSTCDRHAPTLVSAVADRERM